MSNKLLIIVFVGMIVAIGYLLLKSNGVGNTQTSGSGNATISLSTDPNPLRMGPATFIIEVKDNTGKPVDNAKVNFDLNMTAMNMGTQKGDATEQGNGKYSASGRMTMQGPWKVSTTVTMPDGTVTNKDFTVNVP